VDAVITVSRQSCQDLIKYLPVNPKKINVIPEAASLHFHPLNEAEYLPALERHGIRRPYILSVGSLEPRKNLLRLLEAYARLEGSRPSLVIAGARNYWKSSPVVETVSRLGLEQHVRFTGYVEDADLPALYSAASLFVFPSLYEGFGLPVLEAMACGTPVVTSSVSSLPEVAGDAALLVDPRDVDAIASAMRRILDDSDLAADLRARGLARAAQFSWERTARETLAVYEKVLGKS
jgi:glycosyltransferase involved in cell wall biosynthesis